MKADYDKKWDEATVKLRVEMKGWRDGHPKATFREIEAEVERGLSELRAQMLGDMATASEASEGIDEAGKRVVCPQCGATIHRHGHRTRWLKGRHDAEVELTRRYLTCPECGHGFSPLDNELGLCANQQLTPWMEECLVRLGVKESFGQAAEEMAFHHQVTVSKEQARQHTEEAGEVYVQLQESAEAHKIFKPEPAAERLMMSVDACKVLTTTGEWRDVKTVAIAEVGPGGKAYKSSYFSRKSEYHRFAEQAQIEIWRRQIKSCREVCAINDGADWIPPVVTAFRPDATRILDFYHAAEHVAAAGASVFGEGTADFHAWFHRQCHELKEGNPDTVLADLAILATTHPQQAETINATQGYLTKRRDSICYVEFKKAGWPIGSGSGEAAHKVVIQARMKRAGMRWGEDNVDRMAAARNLICNNRWQDDWPLIVAARQSPSSSTTSVQPVNKPSLLPPGFILRPAVPWRNQPVGKAKLQSQSAPPEKC